MIASTHGIVQTCGRAYFSIGVALMLEMVSATSPRYWRTAVIAAAAIGLLLAGAVALWAH